MKYPNDTFGPRAGGRDVTFNRTGNQGMGLDQNRRGDGPDMTLGNWRDQAQQPASNFGSRVIERGPMERRGSEDSRNSGPGRDGTFCSERSEFWKDLVGPQNCGRQQMVL